MKGSYGYITTVLTTILGLFIVLIVTGENENLNDTIGLLLGLAVILGGFAGGFIAPYHVGSNAKKSVLTILIGGGSLLALVYLTFQEAFATNNDPLGGIGLIFIFILLIVGLVIAMVGGIILITLGGLIGSIFGKMVFDREQYPDLDFDGELYQTV